MAQFPRDIPRYRAIRALQTLGFRLLREGNHLVFRRYNADGTQTPLTMPNQPNIKSSTMRAICTQAGISREEFIEAFRES